MNVFGEVTVKIRIAVSIDLGACGPVPFFLWLINVISEKQTYLMVIRQE